LQNTALRSRETRLLVNETWYHDETSMAVIDVLEACRKSKTRIKFRYGHTTGPEAGQDWGDSMDMCGYVSRSGGQLKVPIVLHNRRSHGGPHILDHRIIKIQTARGGRVLYQHLMYQPHSEVANQPTT
jgi:hypothetical protein